MAIPVRCNDLLRQKQKQLQRWENAKSSCKFIADIIFTTIQKFFPEGKETKYPSFSEWGNIIIIADGDHRS